MFFFYGLSVFLLLGALFPRNKQSVYLLLSFSILFILSAYRDISVGTDTKHYEGWFLQFEAGVDWIRYSIEPAWVFLNDLVITYGGGYRDLIVISSFLSLAPIFLVAKRHSHNPMLTILIFYLLYFYFFSWNGIRQSIAVGFVLIGLVYLLKRKHLWFVFIVCFAALFHKSALIALPLIFISKVPVDRIRLCFYIILAMVLGLFGVDYISKIVNLTIYAGYIQNYSSGNILGNLAFLLIFNSFFVFILFTSKKITIELKLFFIFITLLNLTIRVPMGERILMYFSVYQILFYPYYFSNLRFRSVNSKLFTYTVVILFFYILFSRKIGSGSGEILPYTNVLF